MILSQRACKSQCVRNFLRFLYNLLQYIMITFPVFFVLASHLFVQNNVFIFSFLILEGGYQKIFLKSFSFSGILMVKLSILFTLCRDFFHNFTYISCLVRNRTHHKQFVFAWRIVYVYYAFTVFNLNVNCEHKRLLVNVHVTQGLSGCSSCMSNITVILRVFE